MEKYDLIIIGAGVVGPAFAKGLADHGKNVLVLERDLSEPDRIVGELLQPGGVETLKKLGMEKSLEGIDAASIYGYEIIYNGDRVNIPYPTAPNSTTPAQGRGFHHGRFIMKLRDIISKTKGITLKQATVTDILQDESGRVIGVATKNDGKFFAPLVSVCDGINSKFRKQFVSTLPTVESYFVGAILENPDLLAPHHGHVIIGSEFSPVLVYETSPHEARVLCNVPLKVLPSSSNGDLQRWLETNCLPHVPDRLKPSFKKAIEGGKLRSMPNQYLPAIKYDVPGLVVLGDAMNMRHPLTGGGMTVGFGDAYALSQKLGSLPTNQLQNHELVQSIIQEFRAERKSSSAVINVLSIALYHLFAARSAELKILQNGCFRYFLCGGDCVNGPVSLLSGLEARPMLLFYHFFAVAFYSIKLNYIDKWNVYGPLGMTIAFYQTFSVLYTACVVFLPFLFRELIQ